MSFFKKSPAPRSRKETPEEEDDIDNRLWEAEWLTNADQPDSIIRQRYIQKLDEIFATINPGFHTISFIPNESTKNLRGSHYKERKDVIHLEVVLDEFKPAQVKAPLPNGQVTVLKLNETDWKKIVTLKQKIGKIDWPIVRLEEDKELFERLNQEHDSKPSPLQSNYLRHLNCPQMALRQFHSALRKELMNAPISSKMVKHVIQSAEALQEINDLKNPKELPDAIHKFYRRIAQSGMHPRAKYYGNFLATGLVIGGFVALALSQAAYMSTIAPIYAIFMAIALLGLSLRTSYDFDIKKARSQGIALHDDLISHANLKKKG